MTSPARGRKVRKNPTKAHDVSKGIQTEAARPEAISGASTRLASRRPAGVKWVITTRSPRAISARASGIAERTSPRLTAWIQTQPSIRAR